MPLQTATHSGPFHADDVLAFALLRTFIDKNATVLRTRDRDQLAASELVFDVGALHDPELLRFDHHQADYQGSRSSAGLVLDWLVSGGKVAPDLGERLRGALVNYVDDVDNGRVAPRAGVPCFASLVDAYNQPCDELTDFDQGFVAASNFATQVLTGLIAGYRRTKLAEVAVLEAMDRAVRDGTTILHLDTYHPWKEPYFLHGGETHPTEFLLHPGNDGSWRIIAIPPRLGDFAQKRSLPEAWAGLSDEALAAVVGVDDAVFCHKNRFIAVFQTRAGALEAMRSHGLDCPANV